MIPATYDSTPAFEGNVDSVSADHVAGWCWFPEQPERVAELRVWAGPALVTTARAEEFRQDLADAGKRQGVCAFNIVLPSLWQARARSVRVELTDGRVLPPGERSLELPSSLDPDDPFPLRLLGVEGHLETFGPNIMGWIAPPGGLAPVRLSIWEGDKFLFWIDANEWRSDLEDAHLGDGRGGFDVPVPPVLRDGKTHHIDVRSDGVSLLYEPLCVRFEAVPAPAVAEQPSFGAVLTQKLAATSGAIATALLPVQFSFVVNFYNMRREAERTLTSLTRAYQRDADDIRYEVICVDNGSNPPLDEVWIRSFGPEFRLFRPSKILPSPCFALNEAARQARGRYVVAMIDGAHVLSPGVMREAKLALEENSRTVVALRHWFIGGDQRWLNAVGYTREQEDVLFARARWPSDGYNLFGISTPMSENPNHWFDPIAESNCLFVPMDRWREIGGFDEAFAEPGGGFCNLDLLRRAADGPGGLVVLLGEGTFHQYHEGTTTNVSDEAKDTRVRAYADTYRRLRGEDFANLTTKQFRIRGQMQDYAAYGTRQRPAFNAPLGVTTRIRRTNLERRLDAGSLEYLNGTYVESDLHNSTTWRGQRVYLAPGDLTALQDILYAKRPERIVLTAFEPGLITFLDDMARLLGLEDMRIICVTDGPAADQHPRVDAVTGPLREPATLSAVEARIGTAESVLVLLSPRPEDYFPLDALRAYSRFVSFGSYLIVLRTVLGQPWLGYSKYRLKRAIHKFLTGSDFVIDETCTQHMISACSEGFLARVKPPLPRAADEALDHLAS